MTNPTMANKANVLQIVHWQIKSLLYTSKFVVSVVFRLLRSIICGKSIVYIKFFSDQFVLEFRQATLVGIASVYVLVMIIITDIVLQV